MCLFFKSEVLNDKFKTKKPIWNDFNAVINLKDPLLTLPYNVYPVYLRELRQPINSILLHTCVQVCPASSVIFKYLPIKGDSNVNSISLESNKNT